MAWLQSSLEEILSQNHLAKLLLDSWLSGSAWYNKCLLFKLLSLWAIYYVIVGNWNRSIPHKVREIKFQLKVTVELQVSAQGAPGCCALAEEGSCCSGSEEEEQGGVASELPKPSSSETYLILKFGLLNQTWVHIPAFHLICLVRDRCAINICWHEFN